MSSNLNVAVIGGGWIGLYAVKWLVDAGLKVTAFEKESELGGNWVYRDERPGGVAKFTHSTSSKTYMHACDYPMPNTLPHFPHHSDVLKYIHDYADHFDLRKYYRMNTAVKQLYKRDDKWVIVSEGPDGEKTETFDRVASASGITVPWMPNEDAPWNKFTGKVIHSWEYKFADPAEYEGKNVLLVGGGESATDLANELAHVANRVLLSIRTGVWIHDREIGGPVPADVLGNRMVWAPGYYDTTLLWCARFVLEYFWGRGGSGIPEWEPKGKPYMRSFINKSRDVMRRVIRGLVEPRAGVESIDGNNMKFVGRDQPDHIDTVIFCTGFRPNLPYLKDPKCFSQNYHYVFDTTDPTLAFVGTARPIFGSFPGLGEMQARWMAAVWSGQASLPAPAQMAAEMIEINKEHRVIFPKDHERRPTLVNHYEYSERLARKFGAAPNLLAEYRADPRRWWLLVYQTWTPFQYLMNDPKRRETALKHHYDEYPQNHDIYDVVYWGMLLHVVAFHAAILFVVLYISFKVLGLVF